MRTGFAASKPEFRATERRFKRFSGPTLWLGMGLIPRPPWGLALRLGGGLSTVAGCAQGLQLSGPKQVGIALMRDYMVSVFPGPSALGAKRFLRQLRP